MATDHESIPSVGRTLFISPLKTLDHSPHHLSTPISLAASKTLNQLRIILVSPLFDSPVEGPSRTRGVSHTEQWDEVQRLLTYVYVQATKVAQELGRVLMDIDVLLQGEKEPIPDFLGAEAERIFRGVYDPTMCLQPVYDSCSITIG